MMKKKYFGKEGEIAFTLWVFASMVAELKDGERNREKALKLYNKVVDFSSSSWMEIKSTSEERQDLQHLIDELTVMVID